MPKRVDDVRLRIERERDEDDASVGDDGGSSLLVLNRRPPAADTAASDSEAASDDEPPPGVSGCESVAVRANSKGRRGMGRSSGGLGSSMCVFMG